MFLMAGKDFVKVLILLIGNKINRLVHYYVS